MTGEAGINALVAAHYGVPVVLVTGDRVACEETAALIPGVHSAVVKEHVSRLAAHSLHPDRACELIRGARPRRPSAARPPRRRRRWSPGVLEVSVRTTDIAEAATWVRGVERAGDRELRFTSTGGHLPVVLRAILLTRTVAEAV